MLDVHLKPYLKQFWSVLEIKLSYLYNNFININVAKRSHQALVRVDIRLFISPQNLLLKLTITRHYYEQSFELILERS
jgi:hypothetical protein